MTKAKQASGAYQQKDLGYKRTKTAALIRIEFTNGEQFTFPAQGIADDRDENYADEKEDTICFIRNCGLGEYDLWDWAVNNMNWSDVAPYATELQRKPQPVDYQDEWLGGCKKYLESDL